MINNNIKELAKKIVNMYNEQYKIIAPTAMHLILTKSRDIEDIEWHLDRLLDIPTENGQNMFKTLCGYYSTIDRYAANEYLEIYNMIYTEEETKTKKKTLDD